MGIRRREESVYQMTDLSLGAKLSDPGVPLGAAPNVPVGTPAAPATPVDLPPGAKLLSKAVSDLPAGAKLISSQPSVPFAGGGIPTPLVDAALAGGKADTSTVGRIAKAAEDVVFEIFADPLGLAPATLESLLPTAPGESGLRTYERDLIRSSVIAGDVVMRAMAATVLGGIAATGQALQEAGVSRTTANKLERDLLALVTVVGVAAPIGAPVPKTFRTLARRALVDSADSLPPVARQAARASAAKALDDGMAVGARDAGVVPEVPVPLSELRISQPLSKKVVDAAEELLTKGDVKRAPGRLISDQIMELLQTNRLSTDQIGAILTKNGLTLDEFAGLWRVNIRKAAQDMQTLSAVEQRLKVLAKVPGAKVDLTALQEASGIGADTRSLAWWRRATNVWRGLLVTQLSTAMRNVETQLGRVGLDGLQQGLDAGLRRAFLPKGVAESHPTDTFGALLNIFARPRVTRTRVDAVLSAFPKDQDRLFARFMSDVTSRGASGALFPGFGGAKGLMAKTEVGVTMLNAANRFQEFVTRRAIFASRLDGALRVEGKSLEDIVSRNAVGEIPREAVESAVKDALELTFAKEFSPFASGTEGMAGKFVSFVTSVPGLTFPLPFPRFMMNSTRFLYQHSPLGFLRLLSPAERSRIAAGDMSAISRATLGSALFLTGYGLRRSQYAGERWYEIKLPDGRIWDTRAFNPFASFLFVGDIVSRMQDGTLDQLTVSEVVSGLLAAQLRAGTGLFVLDSMLNGLAGLDPGEKGYRAIQEFAGNVLAGLAVPINQLSDLAAQFNDSERIIRSGREGPFLGPEGLTDRPQGVGISLGPVMRNLPGIKESMPEVRSPLRVGSLRRESPLFRQVTGISLRAPKNPVEAEVDRLGLTRKDYFSSTGDPTADRLVAIAMGPLVEKELTPVVENESYKALSPDIQVFVLQRMLQNLRSAAMDEVSKDHPSLAALVRVNRISKRKQRALDALSGGALTATIERLRKEQPNP